MARQQMCDIRGNGVPSELSKAGEKSRGEMNQPGVEGWILGADELAAVLLDSNDSQTSPDATPEWAAT